MKLLALIIMSALTAQAAFAGLTLQCINSNRGVIHVEITGTETRPYLKVRGDRGYYTGRIVKSLLMGSPQYFFSKPNAVDLRIEAGVFNMTGVPQMMSYPIFKTDTMASYDCYFSSRTRD